MTDSIKAYEAAKKIAQELAVVAYGESTDEAWAAYDVAMIALADAENCLPKSGTWNGVSDYLAAA